MDRQDNDSFIDLDKLWSAFIRRISVIVSFVIVAIVLAGLYLFTAQPVYTAMTQLLLDENVSRFVDDKNSSESAQQTDNRISSAVEILKSKSLALRVVEDAKLDQNEMFVNPPKSTTGLIKDGIKSLIAVLTPAPEPPSESAIKAGRREKAAAILQQSLSVDRVGRSSVIAVSIRSPDRQLAATIARTYANSYLDEQVSADFKATERASDWLQGRLTDLNTRSQKAALAVEEYKKSHGLVSSRGELLSSQQLADLNSQLIVAQADTAQAAARYQQYKAIIDKGADAAVNNAVVSSRDTDNSILQDLRKRYIGIHDREQGIIEQFGADHPQAVALKAQKHDIARQIYNELQQLTESFRNDYEVATSRETSLKKSIDQVAGRNSDANVSMVELSELEQKADALKTLYQSFLSRFEQSAQQESFAIPKARIISEAGTPSSPSSPRKTLTLALSIILGGIVGCGAAAFLEFNDRSFRTGHDVRNKLGLRFLGYLPLIGKGSLSPKGEAAGDKATEGASDEKDPMFFRQLMRLAIDAPRSPYTEVLRNARIASDIALKGRKCRVIGVVSCLPGEGSTMVAANLAGQFAMSGQRTLVLDGNLHEPSLSKLLARKPQAGLVEVLREGIDWTKVVWADRRSKLAIMPIASADSSLMQASDIFSSPAMAQLVEKLRDMFEVIVIDLPPLVPVSDAKALEPQIDGFVFVTEWGVTPIKVVENVLTGEPQIADKAIGAILNKTDMDQLNRYSDPDAPERFREKYKAYYDPAYAHGPGLLLEKHEAAADETPPSAKA
ncbi:succinoglycan biosynthesis transport protein ExoP [Rhizobium halophytocola]|uniref:Succinoglycan biosynthesis transport protein ExoP n=2 Tax=Rhizobium halophytocola TaxID=735519 RepID=A0ABS4E4T2_9HYPH|nr:Wzz/FepE/Etk N-terminal domain-containing protein [Rhizobium halophytocola]MBP1852960.1 succinoglycan biosynthesis transport protein ExoP [Rhizobium halophytocola]